MSKYKIYVGCALSGAPQGFRDGVAKIKADLRTRGFDVLEFAWVGDKPKEGVNVYEYDILNVDRCDLLVAICTLPSIGLGMELQRAIELGRPILAFAECGFYVSKIVVDMLEKYGQPRIFRYEDLSNVPARVNSFINDSSAPTLFEGLS